MSLIGKALGLRNQAPVPYSSGRSSAYNLGGMLGGSGNDEANMRMYGRVGTAWQIGHLLASSVAKPEWRMFEKAKTDGRVRYTTSDQGADQRREIVRHQALNVLNSPSTMTVNGREHVFFSRFK